MHLKSSKQTLLWISNNSQQKHGDVLAAELRLCDGLRQNHPGCYTSSYIWLLGDLIVFSTILNEAWHHFAQGIKTAFSPLLFFSPKLHTHLLKNKSVYSVFREILSVIYQQSLTKVYKHAEYLAIDYSTNVQTRKLDNFVLVLTQSSQMPREILLGVYKIQLFNALKRFITGTSPIFQMFLMKKWAFLCLSLNICKNTHTLLSISS